MGQTSKSRSAIETGFSDEQNNASERPRHIPGATITSWRGSPVIDLEALVARSSHGPTVAGATKVSSGRREDETVALSDGTNITFTSFNQYKFVLNT
jgi:hypothetical protein